MLSDFAIGVAFAPPLVDQVSQVLSVRIDHRPWQNVVVDPFRKVGDCWSPTGAGGSVFVDNLGCSALAGFVVVVDYESFLNAFESLEHPGGGSWVFLRAECVAANGAILWKS